MALFISGPLVAGIRCLDVPGYKGGKPTYIYYEYQPDKERDGRQVLVTHMVEGATTNGIDPGWSLTKQPLDEIRAKPWSIPQIMMGPLDVLCDWWSIQASQPADPNMERSPMIGSRSHSHVNELGVLFTAIAGMLNLLAIIDSSHRATYPEAA